MRASSRKDGAKNKPRLVVPTMSQDHVTDASTEPSGGDKDVWSMVHMQHAARASFMGLWTDDGEVATNARAAGTAAPTGSSAPRPPRAPCIELAKERARARLPKDGDGLPFKWLGLIAPIKAVRTLGSDAAFYVRFVQEGFIVMLLILIIIFPAISFNMGGGPYTNWTLEYQPFVDAGLLTGTDPDVDTWTQAWPGCGDLGLNGPLLWGRSGGNGELAGASRLSIVQIGCDAAAMILLVAWLVRMQRLMLRDGYVFSHGLGVLKDASAIIGDAMGGAAQNVAQVTNRAVGEVYQASTAISGAVGDAMDGAAQSVVQTIGGTSKKGATRSTASRMSVSGIIKDQLNGVVMQSKGIVASLPPPVRVLA